MKTKDTPVKVHASLGEDVYIQDYSPRKMIDGVTINNLKNFVGEEGDFSEVIRLDTNGELEAYPGFKLRQVNRTRMFPSTIKAWHLHLKQCEIWYIPPSSRMLVALWDTREDSPTFNETMRMAAGGGNSLMIYIPSGVAHGAWNYSNDPVDFFYFVDSQFDIKDPDESRIRWDYLGADFWDFAKD